jgi:hypothetical protein
MPGTTRAKPLFTSLLPTDFNWWLVGDLDVTDHQGTAEIEGTIVAIVARCRLLQNLQNFIRGLLRLLEFLLLHLNGSGSVAEAKL